MDLEPHQRIIVALDMPWDGARRMRDLLLGHVGGFKFGQRLIHTEGLKRIVGEFGQDIFGDGKLHDIPHQVEQTAYVYASLGVKMFTVHCLGDASMLEAAMSGVRSALSQNANLRHPLVLGVTVLTSHDEAYIRNAGFNPNLSVPALAMLLAGLARNAGLGGAVCSPQEADLIRRIPGGKKFALVTPGIRLGSLKADDQRRAMNPRMAMRKGIDYLVIGRPITGSAQPLEEVKTIAESIASAKRR